MKAAHAKLKDPKKGSVEERLKQAQTVSGCLLVRVFHCCPAFLAVQQGTSGRLFVFCELFSCTLFCRHMLSWSLTLGVRAAPAVRAAVRASLVLRAAAAVSNAAPGAALLRVSFIR